MSRIDYTRPRRVYEPPLDASERYRQGLEAEATEFLEARTKAKKPGRPYRLKPKKQKKPKAAQKARRASAQRKRLEQPAPSATKPATDTAFHSGDVPPWDESLEPAPPRNVSPATQCEGAEDQGGNAHNFPPISTERVANNPRHEFMFAVLNGLPPARQKRLILQARSEEVRFIDDGDADVLISALGLGDV